MDSYEFKVVAEDGGGNSQEPMYRAEATVTVKVLNFKKVLHFLKNIEHYRKVTNLSFRLET